MSFCTQKFAVQAVIYQNHTRLKLFKFMLSNTLADIVLLQGRHRHEVLNRDLFREYQITYELIPMDMCSFENIL